MAHGSWLISGQLVMILLYLCLLSHMAQPTQLEIVLFAITSVMMITMMVKIMIHDGILMVAGDLNRSVPRPHRRFDLSVATILMSKITSAPTFCNSSDDDGNEKNYNPG